MESLVQRRRPKTGINIIPLVDVLIVLIFFFMMTMQFRDQRMMDIIPPAVESAGKTNISENMLIGINKEGAFFLNNDPIEFIDLEHSLLEVGKTTPGRSIFVLADQDSPLKHMTSVMDVSRKAGLERVRLQVR